MKILTVHIKNLNSLRLQRKIDFTESPLGDVGLFAITGDTGAGKTTILDAITLGLYGRVHRNKSVDEVMSHGATESFAEVEFLARGKQYKTRWEIRRAYNKVDGAVQPSKQELAEWNAKEERYDILTTRKRDFAEQVEQITGLDYERFQRSVMLSQGDFAAFLKASELQRSELLERITGREIYSKLSIAAFERHKLEKGNLESLTTEFAALKILLPEEVAEIENDLAEAKQAGEQAKQALAKTQNAIQWVEKMANLQRQQETLQVKLNALAAQKERVQPDLDRLVLHQKTLPLQADLTKLELQQQNNQAWRVEIEHLQQRETNLVTAESQKRAIFGQQQTDFKVLKKQAVVDEKLFKKVEKIDLEIAHKNIPLKAQIADLEEIIREKEQVEQRSQGVEQQVSILKKEIDQLTTTLAENENFAQLAVELPQIESLRIELREWYGNKKNTKTGIADLQGFHAEAKAEFENIETQFAQAKTKVKELKQSFKKLAPDYFIDSRSELLHQYQQQIANLNTERYAIDRYCELLEAYDKEISLFSEEQDSQENLQRQLDILDQTLLSSLDTLTESKHELEYRQAIYEQEKLKKNYSKDRQNLQEGEQCPLCFSTAHPFREHHFEIYVDRTKRDYQQAKELHQLIMQSHQKIANQHSELSNKVKRRERGIDLLEIDDTPPINPRILKLEQQIENFRTEHHNNSIYKYTHAATIREKTATLMERHEVAKQNYDELRTLDQELENAERNIIRLELQKNNALIELKSIESRQETQRKILAEAEQQYQKKVTAINEKLALFGQVFAVDTAKQMFAELAAQRADHERNTESLQQKKRQLERTEQSAEQLQKEQKRLAKAYDKLKAQVSKNSAEVARLQAQRKTWFGDKDVETARDAQTRQLERSERDLAEAKEQLDTAILQLKTTRESLADRQQQWTKGSGQVVELTQQLTEQATHLGFVDLAAVLAARLINTEAERIELQRTELERTANETQSLYENCVAELARERARALTDQPISTLRLQAEEQQLAADQLMQTIGSLNEKLAENKRRKTAAASLTQRIETQRKEYQRWATLNSIIGSATGKVFRSFAQGLTLQTLTQLANQHLANLNGRYFIKKSPDRDLELNIVDVYQANNERSMNTLSGGESFLVSLALALGLSDLAGRDTTIRSLFIDEGFGTLDEATLDVAITTLENLQAAGKTIGVISHVKALKERIGTQIQVKKRGSGVSEIAVV